MASHWSTDMESLLFIEDDDGIRLALSMALEDEGYSVRGAANGAEGLGSGGQSCLGVRAGQLGRAAMRVFISPISAR